MEESGIDEGLWRSGMASVYESVYAADAAIVEVWKWERAARFEWDVYRKQHVFPHTAFEVLTLTLRSTLSSFMMTIYPLQTGRLDCRPTRSLLRLSARLGFFLGGGWGGGPRGRMAACGKHAWQNGEAGRRGRPTLPASPRAAVESTQHAAAVSSPIHGARLVDPCSACCITPPKP